MLVSTGLRVVLGAGELGTPKNALPNASEFRPLLSEWTRQALRAADQERYPLAAADAQRHEAELVVAALHLAQRLGRDRLAEDDVVDLVALQPGALERGARGRRAQLGRRRR
jgi:hypothetical protein